MRNANVTEVKDDNMADSDPRKSPNAEPSPVDDAQTFNYVVGGGRREAAKSEPSPHSPLAAG